MRVYIPKSQRERANNGALALVVITAALKDYFLLSFCPSFQKNDFWYRVRERQKSFF